jgi:hypothetical protein
VPRRAAPPFVVRTLPAYPYPLGAAVRSEYTICEMRGVFVLPLYPLQGLVLLPGERCVIPFENGGPPAALARARDHGGAVVAALVDGESVHEVGVTAIVSDSAEGGTSLHGVARCRLVSLRNDDALMARAERFPDQEVAERRGGPVSRLLHARYGRLCLRLGRDAAVPPFGDLSALTWRITAGLGMPPEQQQGFLNIPDPLTRARLLLLTVRELERRERFLRRWAHLRNTNPWN